MFWCTWCTCTVTLHKTNWVGKYQDLFIGTKFCNICKFAIPYGAFYLIFVTIFSIRLIVIILMISGVYAETIWSVYFPQICVSLLVCGTCKLLVIPLLLSPSCKLCILKLFFLSYEQWCPKQQFDGFYSIECWQLHFLPGSVCTATQTWQLLCMNIYILHGSYWIMFS